MLYINTLTLWLYPSEPQRHHFITLFLSLPNTKVFIYGNVCWRVISLCNDAHLAIILLTPVHWSSFECAHISYWKHWNIKVALPHAQKTLVLQVSQNCRTVLNTTTRSPAVLDTLMISVMLLGIESLNTN